MGEFAWDWEIKFLVGPNEDSILIPLSGKTPEPGQLGIVDGDLIEFPPTALGTSSIKEVIVENFGSQITTNLKEPLLGSTFHFTGRKYPGVNGTCLSELKAGETCTLELEFTPQRIGNQRSAATIPYESISAPFELFMMFFGEGIEPAPQPADTISKN